MNEQQANKSARLYLCALIRYYDAFHSAEHSQEENDMVQEEIDKIVDELVIDFPKDLIPMTSTDCIKQGIK